MTLACYGALEIVRVIMIIINIRLAAVASQIMRGQPEYSFLEPPSPQ